MKRIEALEHVFTIIQNMRNKDYDSVTIADTVLSRLEALGMAPPFYDKVQNNNGEKVIIPAREWEQE